MYRVGPDLRWEKVQPDPADLSAGDPEALEHYRRGEGVRQLEETPARS